jgi:hypothetical protein
MLPLMNAKTIAAAVAVAIAATAAAAPPALAWGDKEQGFLAGAVTAIIIDELIDNNRRRKADRPPAPIYVEPPRRGYEEPRHHRRHEERRSTYGSVMTTPAAQAFNSYSRGERREIQRALRSYGYYSGSIDGAFGRGTYNALAAYARASGVPGHMNSAGGVYALFDGLLY